MNLDIVDRLVLLKHLPREGDIVSLRILQKLKLTLGFSEEEIKKYDLVTNPETGDVKADWSKNEEVDIPIGEKATDIIVDTLKKLSKEKKLPEPAIELYEKFIPTTE